MNSKRIVLTLLLVLTLSLLVDGRAHEKKNRKEKAKKNKSSKNCKTCGQSPNPQANSKNGVLGGALELGHQTADSSIDLGAKIGSDVFQFGLQMASSICDFLFGNTNSMRVERKKKNSDGLAENAINAGKGLANEAINAGKELGKGGIKAGKELGKGGIKAGKELGKNGINAGKNIGNAAMGKKGKKNKKIMLNDFVETMDDIPQAQGSKSIAMSNFNAMTEASLNLAISTSMGAIDAGKQLALTMLKTISSITGQKLDNIEVEVERLINQGLEAVKEAGRIATEEVRKSFNKIQMPGALNGLQQKSILIQQHDLIPTSSSDDFLPKIAVLIEQIVDISLDFGYSIAELAIQSGGQIISNVFNIVGSSVGQKETCEIVSNGITGILSNALGAVKGGIEIARSSVHMSTGFMKDQSTIAKSLASGVDNILANSNGIILHGIQAANEGIQMGVGLAGKLSNKPEETQKITAALTNALNKCKELISEGIETTRTAIKTSIEELSQDLEQLANGGTKKIDSI